MAFQEFVLLYPLYALLFAQTGLSTAEISSLFVIWSVAGTLLEIPTGVWADVVSRRHALIVAPLLSAVAFGLWTVAPSYPSFAIGFVLWGAQEALRSGALEALVYETLEHHGETGRYATVMGRASVVETLVQAAAMAVAAPVFAFGGFEAVGAASVAVGLVAAVVAATFREHRVTPADRGRADLAEYAATLREGLAQVRGSRRLLAAVLLVPGVTVIWGALDEYVPLLAADSGAATGAVPLLILLVYVGVAVGGLLAAPLARVGLRVFAVVLTVAAAALAVGALAAPPGFALVAVSFALFQAATVAADARLQDAVEGSARSTVTSLAGFGIGVGIVGVYGLYGAGSAVLGHDVLFAVFAAGYAVVALLLMVRVSGGR